MGICLSHFIPTNSSQQSKRCFHEVIRPRIKSRSIGGGWKPPPSFIWSPTAASRRLHLPNATFGTVKPKIGFGIAYKLFLGRVPFQTPMIPVSQIPQVAHGH